MEDIEDLFNEDAHD
jgi:tRNA(Ile)-lysidine synthase TilS/MesJ